MSTTRKKIAERKAAMVAALRAACGGRDSLRGSAALSQRELSASYGLSQRTVALVMQELVAEGVLYTVPRVGTFTARGGGAGQDCYLFVSDGLRGEKEGDWHRDYVQSGFEGRIAQLGGSCLAMRYDKAVELCARGELPAIKGIFGFSEGLEVFGEKWSLPSEHPFHGVNRVTFRCVVNDEPVKKRPAARAKGGGAESVADVVSFDNEDGGYQAARHLLRAGHSRIGYLGLHSESAPIEEQWSYAWSLRRELGWREALRREGAAEFVAIHPEAAIDRQSSPDGVRRAVRAALRRDGDLLQQVTAVVTANDEVAQGLFEYLQEQRVPIDRWPAVVSFDDELRNENTIVTSLRLPWLELGQEAASLLWNRGVDGERGARVLPMSLIPRLSCGEGWSRLAGDAVLMDTGRQKSSVGVLAG